MFSVARKQTAQTLVEAFCRLCMMHTQGKAELHAGQLETRRDPKEAHASNNFSCAKHATLPRAVQAEKEEEGLQGVFKRLRRNGHQLEKGLQMAQRGPSLE
jgi:hypothetical protein